MFYTSDDAKLFYTVEGNGPALVLLHPMPANHRFWLETAAALSQRYRVILPDLRGHGQSEAGEGPITMARLGADIERLLDQAAVSKAMFAGCSIGGYALYEVWRRMPARVEALAFCCARPQADSDAVRAKREEWIAKIAERGTGEWIESMLEQLIGSTARRRNPEKLGEAREMMQMVTPGAAIALQQGLAARPDSTETAKSMRIPTFVLAAGEDQSSTTADMKLLADLIRSGGFGPEFTEIKDAGHYAPWEQPQMVGRLLRRFFDSVL
ncbi:alpha/beta fold hydrolase [Silvibacterium dinghuense]|uniref:Alpha/beta fold hydrolase n=1 Tax=Silvibacterium dinghuense TaxID=1560006 RepID=A0A4Q1S7Z0_9BACT|nr:alpha/beta fold hydrolase [Silvibacterium dinghuense]